MNTALPTHGLQLQSLITDQGRLELRLVDVPIPAPADDEVLIRVEATPINPSDQGLLLGAADLATLQSAGSGAAIQASAAVPEKGLRAMAGRLGQSLPVGNEGAGTVIGAGASAEAQALLGRVVSVMGGSMYAQYRTVKARQCLVLAQGTSAREAASCFVNPLTALGMTETMRREGHTALIHTAAASNLGQMLNRICLADGIALVCVVRSPEQAALLRAQGAQHVVDSSQPDFTDRLTEALVATGATIAFDAIGGGRLASTLLTCMEAALSRKAGEYSRYGTTVHKQVYIYGGLDIGPTEIQRNVGMYWSVGGWLLTPFLQKIGNQAAQALRERVAREIRTTFASNYSRELSLSQVLQADEIRGYARKGTGAKVLINPSLPL
ncbi:MAG: zinc-binding dehydrogenase [Burkholderiaceae bacterium]